jgi:hypothetical protein
VSSDHTTQRCTFFTANAPADHAANRASQFTTEHGPFAAADSSSIDAAKLSTHPAAKRTAHSWPFRATLVEADEHAEWFFLQSTDLHAFDAA